MPRWSVNTAHSANQAKWEFVVEKKMFASLYFKDKLEPINSIENNACTVLAEVNFNIKLTVI